MSKKAFILQGVTPKTHAQAVRDLFGIADIERVLISVAFVSESGVQQIENELKTHKALVTIFAGVRNDTTSHQGLARLHGVSRELYAVDTGSRMVIFHPKLYLVRGKSTARLVVGSANLTLGGLNNNIEAGMVLDFNLADANERKTVREIEAQFDAMPRSHPKNILKIKAIADIDNMLASGRIVDEMALPPPKPSTSAGSAETSDTVPRIKLKVPPIYRALSKAKAVAKQPKSTKTPAKTAGKKAVPQPAPATAGVEFELVWESKPLERRDLTIPKSKKSNPTGSINLDKGLSFPRNFVFQG